MTREQLTAPLPDWVTRLLLIVFTAGVAWGTSAFTLSHKANSSEVAEMKTMLQQTLDKVNRIDERQTEIYCATVPAGHRAGCR